MTMPHSPSNGLSEPLTPRAASSRPSPVSQLVSLVQGLSKKDRRRLYWVAAFAVVAIILLILFEAYRTSFETWIQPATDWLTDNDAWSWTIPTVILILLSFPPLFGHEIVMLFVGLAYPIGVGIGIACAGAILGEGACFIVFKYFFTSYVDKKIAQSIRWAATAKVTQEAGFRGVLIIRYSIVPPHLANPLFSCTGMPFWVYMTTVILSLPKTIIFVILSSPDLQNSTGAKVGKYFAIAILVAITIFASRWIGRRSRVAIKEIEEERTRLYGDADTHEMLRNDPESQERLT